VPGEDAQPEGPLKRLERAIRGLREVQHWQALLLEDAQVQVSVLLGTESDQPKPQPDDGAGQADDREDGAG